MSLISQYLHPFKADFIFRNSLKTFRATSGEQGGCSISVMDFLGQKLLESTLFAGELSWWRIQSFSQVRLYGMS
jgi:hypothetical protein